MTLRRWVVAGAAREVTVAAGLAFVLFFAGTAWTPLIGRDEPRFAEAAREMLARGELVVPTFGGVNRYDKPILVYWCTMASYAVFGVNEVAARLPSNVAGALSVLLLAWWARRRWGPGAGLLAGLLLAVSMTFNLEARACTADLVMVLPGLAAMLALESLAVGRGKAGAAAVLWAGLGLATLAKGPVAPAFVVFTGVGCWALARRWKRWEAVVLTLVLVAGWWRLGPTVLILPVAWAAAEALSSASGRALLSRLRWVWGVPLFLVLTVPWAAAAWHATGGEFFRVGFGKHVLARSLSPLESHGGFPGFYVVTAVIAAFPWFAFLPAALAGLGRGVRDEPRLRFLLGWLIGPLIMLELVETKLVHYWLLAYPAGVLLVVGWLLSRREQSSGGRTLTVAMLLLGGVPLAVLPAAVAVHFGVNTLLTPGVVVGVVMLSGLAFAVASRTSRRQLRVMIAVSALYLLGLLGWFLPELGGQLVGPRSARTVLEARRDGERVLIYEARDDELFFYLPLDSINCRPRACLADHIAAGEPFVGVARLDDLERFERERPAVPVRVIDTVSGIDLGHGRWTRMALFRGGSSYIID
ncbi:MAG: glycosyltransferase family 39 protein [Acidobacteria bacterium]|nr:glycosyltransferase family 39 protein [Acidobacteriota bacterium]